MPLGFKNSRKKKERRGKGKIHAKKEGRDKGKGRGKTRNTLRNLQQKGVGGGSCIVRKGEGGNQFSAHPGGQGL